MNNADVPRANPDDAGAHQLFSLPRISCRKDYEAALYFLDCIRRGETELLTRAYAERILEWEDHDYLFED